MKKICTTLLPALLLAQLAFAQQGEVMKERGPFTYTDSLKGAYTGIRQGSDIQRYSLDITIDTLNRYVQGNVGIEFEITDEAFRDFRFELHENFTVTDIVDYSDTTPTAVPQRLEWHQEGSFYTVHMREPVGPGYQKRLLIHYEGHPTVARNAPWDGGIVWSRDSQGMPWISLACEGEGASLWWPCKDHPFDEPDQGVTLHITVPKGLMAVGNGRLKDRTVLEDRERFTWEVSNPINLYNVNIAIGDFTHIHDTYTSKATGDTLSLDYYVLRTHEDKARAHFGREVPRMLQAFETIFGPYPWYSDGYKLVETPFWGMEHQSSIAYGNNYRGLPNWFPFPEKQLFDFIIVHESGHEWFGNSISCADKADMWLHEAFTTYTEAAYTEFHYGTEKAQQYLHAQRSLIEYQETMQGPAGVAFDAYSDADMYFKGTWMLHTIRHGYATRLLASGSVHSEEEATKHWWAFLQRFYMSHQKRVISGEEVIIYFETELGRWAGSVLRQYLQYIDPPLLELQKAFKGDTTELRYRLVTPYQDLEMPLMLNNDVVQFPVTATTAWQNLPLGAPDMNLQPNLNHCLLRIRTLPDAHD